MPVQPGGADYSYRAKGVNSLGSSNYSSIASIHVKGVPGQPTIAGVDVLLGTEGQVSASSLPPPLHSRIFLSLFNTLDLFSDTSFCRFFSPCSQLLLGGCPMGTEGQVSDFSPQSNTRSLFAYLVLWGEKMRKGENYDVKDRGITA